MQKSSKPFSVRSIALCGIFIAFGIVLSALDVWKLDLDMIPLAICAMLLDWRLTVAVAVLGDVIGYVVIPSNGGFNVTFTISVVLSAILFSLLLSKNAKVFKIIAAVAINSICFLWLLNSFWLHILFKAPIAGYLVTRAPKLAVMMVVDFIILYAFSKRGDIIGKFKTILHKGQ